MNEYEEYAKIIKNLIRESFPSLIKKKVKIKVKNKGRFSASARRGFFSDYIIYINSNYCSSYDSEELVGLFAHELCHAEKWEERGYLKQAFIDILLLFPHFNEKEEKGTDIRAICKGFKKEIRHQKIKRRKKRDKNFKKLRRFYLTPNEVLSFDCSRVKDNNYLHKFNTSNFFV